MNAGQRHHRARGMSMLELIIVLAVSVIVAAMVLPNVLNAIYNIRLRAAANDVAGLLQDAHFRAIRDNTFYPVCYAPSSTATGKARIFYIDITAAHNCVTPWSSNSFADAHGNTVTFPTVQLGGNITRQVTGFPAITSMSLGFTPLAVTALPYFSSRGTPCAVSAANTNVCLNIDASGTPPVTASYQIYLTDTRPTGSNGWAAVTVSPAGRIKVWMWDGASWE
jgi:prepilin-type N-terminal cleavage/methylation domain-containing protein